MDQNLRDVLMPLAVIGSFTVGVVVFTRTLTDYILKKRMIDKGYVNDDAQAIFKRHSEENKYTSLKWGLLIFFAGLSLIIVDFIDVDRRSSLPYGLFAMFVSFGFLVYYFIVKKELNK